MKYGQFDDDKREYVILRPDTPIPWLNYLGTRDYIGLISNTAGGYSFYRDARLRRLIRYRYNDLPSGINGRYLYVRDEADGKYWSPTWQPTQTKLDNYRCRHGLGYTIIASSFREIEVEATYFIPPGEAIEVWSIRIVNHRTKVAELSLVGAIEFCLWDALDDATNFQRNLNIGEVEVDQCAIFHKTGYRERRDHFTFFACSEPTVGFDTQRDAFLGPYRGWDRPIGLERGKLADSHVAGCSPIGAHHVRLTLDPGEEERAVFLLGYHENRKTKFRDAEQQALYTEDALLKIAHYRTADVIDRALERLHVNWRETLSRLQVTTPVPDADRMLNTWTPYQCAVCFNVSRSASGFESGIGRGIGFRDANQDLLGYMHLSSDRARQRILDLASTQLESGGAYHQYQPLTRKGNDAIGGGFNDDPLWLILSTSAYLKETGAWSILDERVPYDGAEGSETSLYEHLTRAVEYTLTRLGPHGLPLIGRADWNDCLNLNSHTTDPDESFQTAVLRSDGTAESVFIAGLFCLVVPELVEIAKRRGDERAIRRFSEADSTMRCSIEAHGWDGRWYLRAYDAFGRKVGSHKNKEGQIYIEPQGICAMAGLGLADGRALTALDEVSKRLASEHGLLLLQPAYTRYDPALGEITSYPPGYKENGSIFCHTNPWIVISECRLGRGDRAWEVAMRINPAVREEMSKVHRCEPYVYAQTIVGRDGPDHGRARNSWLTGTASWMYVALTQWVLGIRPSYGGIEIDPCIPPRWDAYSVVRAFRGAVYNIRVENPDHVSRGVREVRVDGRAIVGSILPAFSDGATHNVQVTLRGEQ